MSNKLMIYFISKMHSKLNDTIKKCNYDLLDERVLNYSRKLDKAIAYYSTRRECS